MPNFLPMWIDGLTPEVKKKAEVELGETEEVKTQALKELRRLIHEEKDFRPQIDDGFLLRFLRVKKFDVKKAYNLIRNYYTFRLQYAQMMRNCKPSEFMEIYQQNNIDILPRRHENGSSIGLLRIGFFDMESFNAEDLLVACILGFEMAVTVEMSQICEGHLIIDFKNFSFGMLRQFGSPKFLFKVSSLIQNCLPVRIGGIHFINEPFYFSLFFNTFKQFLSAKMRSRIQVYGKNLRSLHKVIPPELLPQELGGMTGPFDNSNTIQRLLNLEPYLVKSCKYGYLEHRAKVLKKKSSELIQMFLRRSNNC